MKPSCDNFFRCLREILISPHRASRHRVSPHGVNSRHQSLFPQSLSRRLTTAGIPLISRIAIVCSTALVYALPTSVWSQQISIDITIAGENTNEINAREQWLQLCESYQGLQTLTAEQTARLTTCQQIEQLDAENANDVLQLQAIENVIVPEEYFVLSDLAVTQSDFQTTNVYQRLEVLRSATAEAAVSSAELSKLKDADTHAHHRKTEFSQLTGGAASGGLLSNLGVFTNGYISSGDGEGGEFQQDTDFSIYSTTIGADYRLNNKVVIGGALGLNSSSTDFKSVRGGNDSQGFNLTLFGTWYESDLGYIDGVMDIGITSNDLDRQVNAAGSSVALVSGSTEATTVALTTSAGRNFSIRGWEAGVYVRISLLTGTIDGFEEKFVNSNLGTGSRFSVDSQDINSTTFAAGGDISRAFSTKIGVIIPKVRLEFESESDKSKDSVIAEVDGISQDYIGSKRDSSYSNLGIGASMVLKNGIQVYGYYETHLQHDFVTQNWIKAGARITF